MADYATMQARLDEVADGSLTVSEAAAALHMTEEALRMRIHRGVLTPVLRLGRTIRIPKTAIADAAH